MFVHSPFAALAIGSDEVNEVGSINMWCQSNAKASFANSAATVQQTNREAATNEMSFKSTE